MAKNTTKSQALVPAERRQTTVRRKTATPVVVPATADTLLPILGSEFAAEKLIGDGGEVAREGGVALVTGRAYATRDCVVPAEEIFYDQAARPGGKGAWLGEADKVSWRDTASGYDCIMLRNTDNGFLCGYVGIPQDHPLWGWDANAVPPDIWIDVHGGLTYSRLCEEGPSPARRLAVEARRICHVTLRPAVYHPVEHATDHRVEDSHAWWFGFSCDHAYDLIPNDRPNSSGSKSSELGRIYRDDAYVVRETVALAAQLRAIAEGGAAPARDGAPPPLGLDPRRGGGRG